MPRQALAEAIHFNQCNVSVPGRGDHRDGAALGLRMGLEPKTDALRMQPHHAVGGLEMDQGAGVGGVALGTDPAPIPRHIRYSRYSRYRADFIGTFCPLSSLRRVASPRSFSGRPFKSFQGASERS
jgi:hypothetical protein